MDQAEHIGIGPVEETQSSTIADGRHEPLAEEVLADIGGVEREHLADDGLSLAIAGSHPLALAVDDVDDVALLGSAFDTLHGAGENPWMAAQQSFLFAGGYN